MFRSRLVATCLILSIVVPQLTIATGSFGHRNWEDAERTRRLSAERRRLLEKLGLGENDIPRVDFSKLALNRHIANIEAADGSGTFGGTDEERIVISNPQDDPHCVTLIGELLTNCVHFDIDQVTRAIASAYLVLTLADEIVSETLQLNEIKADEGLRRTLLTQRVSGMPGETIQIDITDVVKEWSLEPQTAHTLQMLRCELCNEQNDCTLCASQQFIDSDRKVAPVIQISLDGPESHRKRRSTACAPHGSCCLHYMYVNFTEIGFDNFIIAPHGYSANYCAGRCAKHENMNGHRRLLQNITEPCCAPAKYDPFEVLYAVSETDIRKRLLHGITVSECGCLA